MLEIPRNLEFHHVPYGQKDEEHELIGELADVFKNNEYVKNELVKDYVKKIVERVHTYPNTNNQRACIMDFLREENIKKLLDTKQANKQIDKDNLAEIEKMTTYWINEIRKKIIQELRKYLPDDLCFFVKEKFKTGNRHNKKSIIVDNSTKKEYFLKEQDIDNDGMALERKEALTKLTLAIASLADPKKDMPFIIAPKKIGHTKSWRKYLTQVSDYEDFTDLGSVITTKNEQGNFYYEELNEVTAKKVLNSIIDCLRGAKFMAQNGLTVMDLNTVLIGKNLGINNKTKRGVIFDLDGIAKVGTEITCFIGPRKNDGQANTKLFAPEYRQFIAGIIATAESMIWEIGDSIRRLAEIQIDIIFEDHGMIAKPEMIAVWNKLKEFSKKMTYEAPADRPPFDICIAKLEEITNKFPNS